MEEQQTKVQATPESSVSLPDDLETLIEMGYEKANREWDDPDRINSMSEEQLREFLSPSKKEEPKQTVTEQTVTEPETTDNAEPAPVEQTKQAPETDKAWEQHPEVVKLRESYANLQKLYGTQTAEVGQMRQVLTQVQPLLENLSDPRFQQHVLNFFSQGHDSTRMSQQTPEMDIPADFNPYDPQQMETIISNRVQAALQMERQKQTELANRQRTQMLLNTFQNNVNYEQQRLIASGVNPAVVNAAVQKMSELITQGKFVEAAVKYYNLDNMIAEAEARGREAAKTEFQKQIQEASQIPTRTAGAGARQSTSNNAAGNTGAPRVFSECETPEQLMALVDRMEFGSKNWNEAVEYGASKGWPEFIMGSGSKNYR